MAEVQGARRFIEEQRLRVRDEGLRHEDQLLLPAREARHRVVRVAFDVHEVKRAVDLLQNFVRDAPTEVADEPQHHHLKDRQAASHLRQLRQVRDVRARKHPAVLDELGLPRIGEKPRGGFEQRRLPAAVSADDGDHFAALQGRRNVGEDGALAPRDREAGELEPEIGGFGGFGRGVHGVRRVRRLHVSELRHSNLRGRAAKARRGRGRPPNSSRSRREASRPSRGAWRSRPRPEGARRPEASTPESGRGRRPPG